MKIWVEHTLGKKGKKVAQLHGKVEYKRKVVVYSVEVMCALLQCLFTCSKVTCPVSLVKLAQLSLKCTRVPMKKKVNKPPPAQLPPLKVCSVCKGCLIDRSDEAAVECTIVSSESFDSKWTSRKICTQKSCRVTHRGNYAYHDGVKVNTLTFNQMEKLASTWWLNTLGSPWLTSRWPSTGFCVEIWHQDKRLPFETCWWKMVTGPSTPKGFNHTWCEPWKAMPWPVDFLTKLFPFPWIDLLHSSSSTMTPSSSHRPAMWRCSPLMGILVCTGACTRISNHHAVLPWEGVQKRKSIRKNNVLAPVPTKKKKEQSCRTGQPGGNLSLILIPGMLWQQWSTQWMNPLKKRSTWLQRLWTSPRSTPTSWFMMTLVTLSSTSKNPKQWRKPSKRSSTTWWMNSTGWTTNAPRRNSTRLRKKGWKRFAPTCQKSSMLGFATKTSCWTPWMPWATGFGWKKPSSFGTAIWEACRSISLGDLP